MNRLTLTLFLILTLVSCGKEDGSSSSDSTPEVDQSPVEVDYSFVNSRKVDDRIFLESFRYRELYTYTEGQASVVIPKRTTLTLTENDIKVFVKVDESDLSRVNGLTLKGSEQPWAQMKFKSQVTDDIVKICVQFQPKSQMITKTGLTEVELNKKTVFTALGDSKNCVGISANGIDVFNGIEKSYLVVDDTQSIEAEAKSDMKAGNQRVGTQVEFSFEIEQ